MENLDKLTTAGVALFDLNTEYLARCDWSRTPLGGRRAWPPELSCYVHLISTFPHAAAVFWGNGLCIVHNLAWGKATGNLDGQGARAHDSYSGEALNALETSARGHTVKVAFSFLLPTATHYGPDSINLLSTLLDNKGTRQGVLAQLFHNPTVEKHLPMASLDGVSNGFMSEEQPSLSHTTRAMQHPEKLAHRTKPSASQQTGPPEQEQSDTKQIQLFERFAEFLPNGLAILDSNAEAIFVNDGFFRLTTNRTSKEFRAWPESIDHRDHERVMALYRKAFSSRQELRVEFRCSGTASSKGEDEEWRLFLLRPLSSDPEAGFISAVVDITEIKQAQLAQERAATEARVRKEQQERFIDMVSHEIRNPLSAVLHLAEEIKEVALGLESHTSHPDKIADILDASETILLCVSHQNTLVDDILSFSKLDSMMLSLVPRETQPKWSFSQALKVFHSEFKAKGIDFYYVMDVSYDQHHINWVLADLNRMKQVLVNLITNAIKFTSRKDGERRICVSMGASSERPPSYPPDLVYFDTHPEAFHVDSTMSGEWGSGPPIYIMVAIRDTGIGISAHDQAKLFERFRQATPKTQEHYGGSGLGLFISRKLCQLHGGDVGVSSKEGEGSTFGFYFRTRRSDGTADEGRPQFGRMMSRASSEQSITRPTTPRPPYSRNNSARHPSALSGIQERPSLEPLTSRRGIDTEEVSESLKNPPTEYREEAHPAAHGTSARLEKTDEIAQKVQPPHSVVIDVINSTGETRRQTTHAEHVSRMQSHEHSGACSTEHPRTLLLVEDNLINQKVLRRQLQARGFEVEVANNGQEAIDAVAQRGTQHSDSATDAAHHDPFDCILMDQEMPVKDGNTATSEIRALQTSGQAAWSPILGVSANVREAQTISMMEAGMDSIISKPFKVDELVTKVGELLDGKEESSQPGHNSGGGGGGGGDRAEGEPPPDQPDEKSGPGEHNSGTATATCDTRSG